MEPKIEYKLFRCLHCGQEVHSKKAKRCIKCSYPIVNFCTEPTCNHINPIDAPYCEECGYPTEFYEAGLLFHDYEL